MERRQFLQATLLGATATILNVVPRAVATTHLSFPQENAMSDARHPYDPLNPKTPCSSSSTIRSVS